MSSTTDIVNLALGEIGVGTEVNNLETEKSQEAQAARRFFPICRDATLRDARWTFARKIFTLELVEENPNSPNQEWLFSYRMPADVVQLHRIISGFRVDTALTRVPYKLYHDDQGKLIYTNKQNAQIEYTGSSIDPEVWPPDFVMALSYRLAMKLLSRLSAGDPFKNGPRITALYLAEIGKAQAQAFNEEQVDLPPESSFINERNSGINQPNIGPNNVGDIFPSGFSII